MVNESEEILNPETRAQIVGHFAAGVAHDLNNELTLILNHLERPDVPLARRSSHRCTQLASSLLAFCTGEGLNLEKTNVPGYLTALASELPVAPGVRIDVEFEDALPDILSEPFALPILRHSDARRSLENAASSRISYLTRAMPCAAAAGSFFTRLPASLKSATPPRHSARKTRSHL